MFTSQIENGQWIMQSYLYYDLQGTFNEYKADVAFAVQIARLGHAGIVKT